MHSAKHAVTLFFFYFILGILSYNLLDSYSRCLLSESCLLLCTILGKLDYYYCYYYYLLMVLLIQYVEISWLELSCTSRRHTKALILASSLWERPWTLCLCLPSFFIWQLRSSAGWVILNRVSTEIRFNSRDFGDKYIMLRLFSTLMFFS